MLESEETGYQELESCSYRDLQRYAKSMGLPSNVKKVYLIEMIHAKKFLSDEDLETIIDRIKMERKVNSQTKKKKPKRKPFRLQMTEVSSTSDQSHPSPPITLTPKRPSSYHVQYSPGMHDTVIKYQPRKIMHPTTSIVQPMTKTTSDRVLRSNNSIRKPNYRIMNESNCVIDVVKAQNTVQQVRQRTYQSVSVIHKHRPILNPTAGNREHGMNPTAGNRDNYANSIVGNRVYGINTTAGNREQWPMNNVTTGNKKQWLMNNVTTGNKKQWLMNNVTTGNKEQLPMSGYIEHDREQWQMNNVTTGNKKQLPMAGYIEHDKRLTVENREQWQMDNVTVGNKKDDRNLSVGNREQWLMDNVTVGNKRDDWKNVGNSEQMLVNTVVRNRHRPLIISSLGRKEQQRQNPSITVPRAHLRAPRIKRIIQNVNDFAERQMVPVARSANISPKPARRQRKLSGIYPLNQDRPYYNYVPTVGFRRQDGRVTKINAVIQRGQPNIHPNIIAEKKRSTVTVQDVINYNVDKQTFTGNNEVGNQKLARNMEPNLSRNMYNAERHIRNKTSARLREQNLRINAYNSICYMKNVETNSNEYQVEYERFHEERKRDLSMQNRRGMEYARYGQEIAPEFDRNLDYSRSIVDRDGSGQESNPVIIDLRNALRPINDRDIENENGMEYSRREMDFNQNTNEENYLEYSGQNVVVLRNPDDSRNVSPRNENDTNPSSPAIIDLTHNTRKLYQETLDYSSQQEKYQNSQFQDMDEAKIAPQYPNMAALTDVFPEKQCDFSVYYHKKIRSEQVRHKVKDGGLPRISDVFSQFNGTERSDPLYVNDGERMKRVLAPPPILAPSDTCMLESLYNFKSQFVTNPPILKIATTDTYSTYSTNTVATAMAYPSSADLNNNDNPYERPSLFQDPEPLVQYEYLKPDGRTVFECDEVLNSSTASLETSQSQELGANVTIPAIVEDALELISQDGDYMERIGMDVRVQCVLCNWAGPKVILEYHIKKDHPNEVQIQDNKDWSILLALSSLISHSTWYSQLVQHEHTLYVLSARYGELDTLMIALSMIPSEFEIQKHCKITIYNKISGKPYIFEGEVKDIPDSMPYDYPQECLSVDISSLDLIPNSANLTLVNRELVVNLPNKAIVGRDLNNVEIVVYVKILD